jgi:aminoglycoside 6'-N-acetyltransferase
VQDSSFEPLVSERLLIRRFEAGDAEAFSAYRSQPEVARYQAWEVPFPVHEAEQFIASLSRAEPGSPGSWFQFAVGLRTSRALIGDIALRTTRGDPRQAELGFTFATTHQGQGYAAEAVECVLGYAFDRLKMHRVFALTDVRNHRAQQLLERLRFRREGELRDSTWFKGEGASERLYARLASEPRPEPGR